MYKKALGILIAATLSFALFTGCGNKAEEALGEIEGVQELADARTPEPTTEPTKESVATEASGSTLEPADTAETVVKEETTKVESTKQNTGAASASGPTTDEDLSDISWEDLPPAVREELKQLEMIANMGSGGNNNNSSSSSTSGSSGTSSSAGNNNSSGSASNSSGGTSSSGSTGSNTGSTTSGTGNTGNTGSTGNTTPSSASSNPASEQPAQHSHNYTWAESGDSRILICSCGVTTGITEYRYGSVWGYYDDGAASEVFNLVNVQRDATIYTVQEQGFTIAVENVPALNTSGDLTSKAKSRAVEAATNFDHGENYDECLAWGYVSATDTIVAWCYSQSHARAITDPEYVSGGTACFWFDSDNSGTNLTPIWVLELSR